METKRGAVLTQPAQILKIDPEKHCLVEEVPLNVDEEEILLLKLGIFGPQHIGKSTFLNHLSKYFHDSQVDFQVGLNPFKQTTRGIHFAKLNKDGDAVCFFDSEGIGSSDNQVNRPRDEKRYLRQVEDEYQQEIATIANFMYSFCDILVILIDIRTNLPALKNCFYHDFRYQPLVWFIVRGLDNEDYLECFKEQLIKLIAFDNQNEESFRENPPFFLSSMPNFQKKNQESVNQYERFVEQTYYSIQLQMKQFGQPQQQQISQIKTGIKDFIMNPQKQNPYTHARNIFQKQFIHQGQDKLVQLASQFNNDIIVFQQIKYQLTQIQRYFENNDEQSLKNSVRKKQEFSNDIAKMAYGVGAAGGAVGLGIFISGPIGWICVGGTVSFAMMSGGMKIVAANNSSIETKLLESQSQEYKKELENIRLFLNKLEADEDHSYKMMLKMFFNNPQKRIISPADEIAFIKLYFEAINSQKFELRKQYKYIDTQQRDVPIDKMFGNIISATGSTIYVVAKNLMEGKGKALTDISILAGMTSIADIVIEGAQIQQLNNGNELERDIQMKQANYKKLYDALQEKSVRMKLLCNALQAYLDK